MGFDDGQIVLNSDNGTYYPGQMLCGRLEFDLDKDKQFRGIYADIKGKCKVHWTTSHSRRVNDRTEHYTVTHESYEEYMNTTIYLIGSKSGEQTLHPGRHVFPFECQIPPHCPSSFEGSDGSIRYGVKVTVDRAFKLDQTKAVDFRVVAPLDLNANPQCKEPFALEFYQAFCSWCMHSGMAETLVKLPAAGFCPKQIIPIEVACKNGSSVELNKIVFTIKKQVIFEAVREPDTRSQEETVVQLKKGPVPGNTTRNWTVEMEIPDMDAPNLDTCRFININYTFKVEIQTSGCHVDEDDSHPLYIGSIPLASLQYPPNSEMSQNTIGVTSYPTPVINQPLPNYHNGPPYPGANSYPGNTPNIGFNAPQNTPYTVSPFPGPTPYPVSPNLSANPPYPSGNSGSPYNTPGNSNAPYQPPNSGRSSPYPATNAPHTGTPNMGAHPPYPGPGPTNSPYSTNPYPASPNVGTNPPYPASPNIGTNPPYPTSPNVGTNPPYPTSPNVGTNPPYPTSPNVGTNPPYPTSPNFGTNSYPPQSTNSNLPTTNSPYAPTSNSYTPGKPAVTTTFGLKTGNIGFPGNPSETMPMLPPGAMPRAISPFASASAPAPPSPDDEKKLGENVPPYPQ